MRSLVEFGHSQHVLSAALVAALRARQATDKPEPATGTSPYLRPVGKFLLVEQYPNGPHTDHFLQAGHGCTTLADQISAVLMPGVVHPDNLVIRLPLFQAIVSNEVPFQLHQVDEIFRHEGEVHSAFSMDGLPQVHIEISQFPLVHALQCGIKQIGEIDEYLLILTF